MPVKQYQIGQQLCVNIQNIEGEQQADGTWVSSNKGPKVYLGKVIDRTKNTIQIEITSSLDSEEQDTLTFKQIGSSWITNDYPDSACWLSDLESIND